MKTRLLTIVSELLLLTAAVCHGAAAYSTPPSWNPMSMPGVTYNSTSNVLNANPANNTTPGYYMLWTNTLASNGNPAPGIASFDPASPVSVLNDTAFSRKIGWYDPNEGIAGQAILDQIRSVYGPGAYLWIDCLSKSAGLNTYLAVGLYGVNANYTQIVDYANPTGVPYSPIFGTPGSSMKWQWDGLMDHNAYAVPFSELSAPNQPFSATYRIYVGDVAGNELLVNKNGTPVASAATTTTWSWTGPPFVFTSQTGVAAGTLAESDVFTATGIPTTTPYFGSSAISVTGGEYAISTDGVTFGPWTALVGTIANTNKVKVRQTSAVGHGVSTTATLTFPWAVGPGTFKITTTTVPNPAWPVKIQDGFDQPSLAYAYSIAPDMFEPNNTVIMVKDGILPTEASFSAGRDITVTLRGGYNADFSSTINATIIQGASNVLTVTQGKVIVDKVYIQSTVPL